MAKKATEKHVKTPTEDVKANFDFAKDLQGGDSITGTPTINISPSGGSHLTKSGIAISGTKVQALFSGGVAGTLYTVDCFIDTVNGQKFEGRGEYLVENLG